MILVGDDPASAVYVRHKTRACEELGYLSVQLDLPATASQDEVLHAIETLNADPDIDGLLVQLPLPEGLDERGLVRTIRPDKDVDCQHPESVAALAVGTPTFVPATPLGIMEILHDEGVEVRGAEVVIVGRSNIVGRPLAALMLVNDATVTVCHSRTRDLGEVTRRADILVVATGRVGLVTGDMVKPGAAVIDVGINRTPSPEPGGKDRLVGDVDRPSVEPVAGRLTPVPGGVGPLTIAMLMRNTLAAARAHDEAR